MTSEEIILLNKKAKTRKDGIYSFRGNLWVVKNNKFVAFCDCFGNCFQRAGVFNFSIGKVASRDAKKSLTEWLKSQ